MPRSMAFVSKGAKDSRNMSAERDKGIERREIEMRVWRLYRQLARGSRSVGRDSGVSRDAEARLMLETLRAAAALLEGRRSSP